MLIYKENIESCFCKTPGFNDGIFSYNFKGHPRCRMDFHFLLRLTRPGLSVLMSGCFQYIKGWSFQIVQTRCGFLILQLIMQRYGTSFQMMIGINLHVLFRAVWVIMNDFVCDPVWCNVFPLFCADSERKVEIPCNLCVGPLGTVGL